MGEGIRDEITSKRLQKIDCSWGLAVESSEVGPSQILIRIQNQKTKEWRKG